MQSQTASERRISISPSLAMSFGEEQRELMQRRCKLLYLLGFLIAGTVHVFYVGVVGRETVVATPFTPWQVTVYDLHVASFAVATLLVFARTWGMGTLLTVDLVLFAFNILLTHFFAVVYDLNRVPIFGVSMLLFLHASFVPVRVGAQAGLAAVGAFGFAITAALGYALIPELQQHWLRVGGGAAFRTSLLEGTFQLGMLALVSVVITKALYHMRLSLHQAQRLGNYLIKGELGGGGMGQVYIAEHALMSRPTALKVLKAPPGEADAWLARFEREVRLSAGLSHPNTITVYDFGRSGRDTFYYAMEYLEGLNLEELVMRFGPVAPERAVFILTQVCGSLTDAHERGIMHRDIKPSNIHLTCRGGLYDYVKVLDFGLAKPINPDHTPKVTKTGMFLGTPQYVAPEIASGSDGVDGRADLYGLGGVAYWMLVGRPAFEATTSAALIREQLNTYPRRPAELSELAIPPALDHIIMRCLEKNPDDRFATAAELEAALRAVELDEPWTWERARAWWVVNLPGLVQREVRRSTARA
ncbi:MAG: serine/threonine protein kinase [Gemmatimonadota bacterium]|nr:MAG: serine/threonine protein kinase [Gemmatimonadota bacterium]